ncbi:MAG: DUF2628 domain-containing protein [Clostridium sp.]
MFCEHCGHALSTDTFCVNPNCPTNDETTYSRVPIQTAEDYTEENLHQATSDKNHVYTQTYDDLSSYYDNNPYNINLDATPTFEDFIDFVGPKRTEYYAERLYDYNTNEGFIKWNWSAFICGFYWLLYRKMWKYAGLYFGVNAITTLVLKNMPGYTTLIRTLILMILVGLFGNQLYVKNSMRKISKLKLYLTGLSKEQIRARIQHAGGTNLWLPLTIIGVIILLIIIAYILLFSMFISLI